MNRKIIYIKRSVAVDGLPKKADMYIVLKDNAMTATLCFFSLENKKFEQEGIIYWLETKELPTKEERDICAKADSVIQDRQFFFSRGANWLLEQIFK